ncbi:MAG TPA: hypothetical protein VK177_04165 [Flavobacteriales bacterium]|nr:hypothetical protein [Flavobacteriales bacterium]
MKTERVVKKRVLIICLMLTPLVAYLEWGQNNHAFLYEIEWMIFKKLFQDPNSLVHPFILLPLAGQLVLLFCLFQKTPTKWLTMAGTAAIFLLIGFIFMIGLLTLNTKVTLLSLPFMLSVLVFTLNLAKN